MQLNVMTWKKILAFSVSVGARPTKRAEYDTNLTTLKFRALCAPRCKDAFRRRVKLCNIRQRGIELRHLCQPAAMGSLFQVSAP